MSKPRKLEFGDLPDFDLPDLGIPDDKPSKGTQKDHEEIVEEIDNAFLARAKQEQQRFLDTCDSEYWCCICFQNRAQKEAFLQAVGWGDPDDKYLDGLAIARQMKIALPPSHARFVKAKPDKQLDALSLSLEKPGDNPMQAAAVEKTGANGSTAPAHPVP